MEKEFDTPINMAELEELGVDSKLISTIEATAKELKAKDETIGMIFPLVVQGNPSYDSKELYIGYFRQPNFKIFSKYLVASSQNNAGAMRTLARDCFLAGDKELIDNDSLFLFGLMGQLTKIIEVRQGALVNLSKTGK